METLPRFREKRSKAAPSGLGKENTEQVIPSPLSEIQNLSKGKKRKESKFKLPLLDIVASEIDKNSIFATETRKEIKEKKKPEALEEITSLKLNPKGKKGDSGGKKDYVKEKKTRTKKVAPPVKEDESVSDELKDAEVVNLTENLEDCNSIPNDIHDFVAKSRTESKVNYRRSPSKIEIIEEKIEFVQELVSVELSQKSIQTSLQIDPRRKSCFPKACTHLAPIRPDDPEYREAITTQLPELLKSSELRNTLASHVKDLPYPEFDSFVNLLFEGIAQKRGVDCISLAINILKNVQKELGSSPD